MFRCFAILWLLTGCVGEITVPPARVDVSGGSGGGSAAPTCETQSGRVVARRLSRLEYNNTVRDLFPFDAGRPADEFPDDIVGENPTDEGLTVSVPYLEKHALAVERLSVQAVATGFLACPPNVATRACAKQQLAPFMRRAWRRPVTEAEVEGVLGYFDLTAREAGEPEPFQQGLRLAVQDVLMSPNFLFRFEVLDQPNAPIAQRLTRFEVANRLSYFIYASMPDAELFAAAESGALNEKKELEAQVTRMLNDPKSAALVNALAGAWLWTDRVDLVNPKKELYPSFDAALRTSLKRETSLFVREFLLTDRPMADMLDADFTYLDQRLATHYGIAATGHPFTDEFTRVSLSSVPTRGGLLTQGAILAGTSAPLNNPTAAIAETNVIVRGKFVLKQLLCQNLELPAGIDFEGIQKEAQKDLPPNAPRKLRDAVRQANATCAACHSQLDPIGFSMEHFDVTGAWRTVDSFGAAVDSSGVLKASDGTPRNFEGARSLGAVIKSDPRLSACATRTVFRLGLGRSISTADQCRIGQWVKAARASSSPGDRLGDLVRAITQDPSFTSQEGEAR
jgi:hypothetical protein